MILWNNETSKFKKKTKQNKKTAKYVIKTRNTLDIMAFHLHYAMQGLLSYQEENHKARTTELYFFFFFTPIENRFCYLVSCWHYYVLYFFLDKSKDARLSNIFDKNECQILSKGNKLQPLKRIKALKIFKHWS